MKKYKTFNENFKITDDKYQNFYNSLIKMDPNSKSVQKSLDILKYKVDNDKYISTEEYDFIKLTIDENGTNEFDESNFKYLDSYDDFNNISIE